MKSLRAVRNGMFCPLFFFQKIKSLPRHCGRTSCFILFAHIYVQSERKASHDIWKFVLARQSYFCVLFNSPRVHNKFSQYWHTIERHEKVDERSGTRGILCYSWLQTLPALTIPCFLPLFHHRHIVKGISRPPGQEFHYSSNVWNSSNQMSEEGRQEVYYRLSEAQE